MESSNIKKELYTRAELQEVMGIGYNTALELLNSDGFPSFKIASKWYVKVRELRNWIDAQSK